MLDRAAEENRDVSRTASDIDQARAQLLLVLGQHGIAGRELLEDDVVDLEAAALHALDDVLGGAFGAGHHVHLGLQPHAGHANRFAYPLLVIDQELLRQDVQDFLVCRYRDGACRIDHPVDIVGTDLLIPDCHDAMRIQAADMAAGDSGIHGVNIATGHQLGRLDRPLDRMHGGFDVDDDTLLEAPRGMRADANDLDAAVIAHLADDGDDLGRADVQADDQVLVRLA